MKGRSSASRTEISYSCTYKDHEYEYRNVTLPDAVASKLPDRLLMEAEWRSVGVQGSLGWCHYATWQGRVLQLRRPLGTDGKTGRVDPAMAAAARAEYLRSVGIDVDAPGDAEVAAEVAA